MSTLSSPVKRAKVYKTGYVSGLLPWYKPLMVPNPKQAEYLLSYLSERQRKMHTDEVGPYIEGRAPVLTVELNGIRYADLFLGPAHPDYDRTSAR